MRCNVDLLKIIQLGVTLFSISGDVPPSQLDVGSLHYQPKALQQYANNIHMCPCTWSFNFQFSLENDTYNEESISMLKKSGADFEKHSTQGIDPAEFGSLLITSGMTLTDDVNWISFHSGYDFAYLVKMLTSKPLPEDEESYRKLVQIFFPKILDVKYLWRHANNLVRRGTIIVPSARLVCGSPNSAARRCPPTGTLGCCTSGVPPKSSQPWGLWVYVSFRLRRSPRGRRAPGRFGSNELGCPGGKPYCAPRRVLRSVRAAALKDLLKRR